MTTSTNPNDDPRYRVADAGYGVLRGFAVFDDRGRSLDGSPLLVDKYRTRSGAEHAARLLNNGVARIEWHAVLGCHVQPVSTDPGRGSLFDAAAFEQLSGQLSLAEDGR